MIKLKLSAKSLTPKVTYIKPVTRMTLGEREEKVLFLSEHLYKEVMDGSKNQQRKNAKKLKKFMKVALVTLGLGLKTAPTAFAAETVGVGVGVGAATGIPGLTTTGGVAITPSLVLQYGLTLSLIVVSAGVALSMMALAVAGIYRMCRKRREAEEWSTDVVKGLVQVLISVPVVLILFFLAQMLFKNVAALNGLF